MKEDIKILVVGDVMLDVYVYGVSNRLSPEAPCAVLSECKAPVNRLGGAANVASQLVASNCTVDLCGFICNDQEGDQIESLIKDKGIGNCLIHVDRNHTTVKCRYLTTSNHQLLRVDSDCNSTLSESECEDILRKIESDKYDVIVLSDYNKGFLSVDICRRILRYCNDRQIISVVDIKETPFDKFIGATVIKGNQTEIRKLAGTLDLNLNKISIEDALELICVKMNCQCVIMTKGNEGISGYSRTTGYYSCRTSNVPIFDVTGAGDVVTAFIALLYSNTKYSFSEVLQLANEAAQLKVSHVGTSVITYEQVTRHHSKIVDLNKIEALRNNRTVVFTNGCFDVLHAGHISLLSQAKNLGDILIVGLNSDSSIKKLKGVNRPINTIGNRIAVLSALSCVDYIITFDELTPANLIEQIRPDVLVKGGDYSLENIVGADFVQSYGGNVVIVPLTPNLSSSYIINQLNYE